MTNITSTRRGLVNAAIGATALPMLASCSKGSEEEVGAVEDLMREHGILRRALLVYTESMPRLRSDPASLDASALNRTAKLFHDFGEEYHERKLEEELIFPKVKAAGGGAASYVDVLLVQHQRGRQITQFIREVTATGRIATGNAEALAGAFETFVLMYQNHAAREDTIVFPAWKETLSARELEELGEQFEDIERAQFGGDGFGDAVKEIGNIEMALGYSDLAQFTAPLPR